MNQECQRSGQEMVAGQILFNVCTAGQLGSLYVVALGGLHRVDIVFETVVQKQPWPRIPRDSMANGSAFLK